MGLKTLAPDKAAELDQDLMNNHGFSLDQLMELAGLSCSQAVYKVHPPENGKNVLVVCGPGNNGGDGLVCARHLFHYGYTPTVYYPVPTNRAIYNGLQSQLKSLSIPFISEPEFPSTFSKSDFIVDAVFGFSFRPPVRDPFPAVIEAFEKTEIPILAVDTPSCWDVDGGPPKEGELGSGFMPPYLISLTAAKPSVKFFKGKRHFIGGRFLGPQVAKKYHLDIPKYKGVDQIVEAPVE